MRVLLDTHTLLWSIADTGRLPKGVRIAIEDGDNDVFVSLASVWEIRIKTAIGKLSLDYDLVTMIKAADFTILPITVAHVDRTLALPLLHRDPFDRMLVAQAQVEGMTLIGADNAIRRYDVPVLWS